MTGEARAIGRPEQVSEASSRARSDDPFADYRGQGMPAKPGVSTADQHLPRYAADSIDPHREAQGASANPLELVRDPAKLAAVLKESEEFKTNGKLGPRELLFVKESMRFNSTSNEAMASWAVRLNEGLKGTGISVDMGNSVVVKPGVIDSAMYTAQFKKNESVTESVYTNRPPKR
jgi:hypothetical protein